MIVRVSKLSLACTVALALLASTQVRADEEDVFRPLLQHSQSERKGLVFYVGGQTIAGVVVRLGDDEVEVRNQTHDRIIIRLDRIDALAGN